MEQEEKMLSGNQMEEKRPRGSRWKKAVALILVLAMCSGVLFGCSDQEEEKEQEPKKTEEQTGQGTLTLEAGAEISIGYDVKGKVTGLEGINEKGKDLVEKEKKYEGKKAKKVISGLVTDIRKEGYLKTDKKNKGRDIVLRIEEGSRMPDAGKRFITGIVSEMQDALKGKRPKGEILIKGEKAAWITQVKDVKYGKIAKKNNDKKGNKNGRNDSNSSSASKGAAVIYIESGGKKTGYSLSQLSAMGTVTNTYTYRNKESSHRQFATYTGVPISKLLSKAGASGNTLLFIAKDGYAKEFSRSELTGNKWAFSGETGKGGKSVPAIITTQGQFACRLVFGQSKDDMDKRGDYNSQYWVKNIKTIEVY